MTNKLNFKLNNSFTVSPKRYPNYRMTLPEDVRVRAPQINFTKDALTSAPLHVQGSSNCFERAWNSIVAFFKSCFASTTMSGPKNLISFYRGQEPNNRQATFEQILSWDDGQLEADHNYIQWLFPLASQSNHNRTAPVLDAATIQTFRNDAALKSQMLRSFRRILPFYGLQMNEATLAITRAPNFNARATVWLTPPDQNYHNFLRITRIIRSMNILGLPEYGKGFFAIMEDIARNEGAGVVSPETLRIWRSAS